MEDIRIRKATLEDSNIIYKLNCEQMGYDNGLEKTVLRLAYLMNNPNHRIYVAEIHNQVVGYVHGNNHDLTYSDPLKNIMGLAVKEDYKRRGIGHLLLNEIEKWAKKDGALGVRLVSGESRTGSHAFYEACGYECKKNQKNYIKYVIPN